jgi:hypothetical protein
MGCSGCVICYIGALILGVSMDHQAPSHTKEALSPLFHHLHQACHSAFNALQEDSHDWWFKTSSRSKASLMRDYLVYEIKNIIEDYKSIRCINKQGLTIFAINEQFAMRIKKLNKKTIDFKYTNTAVLRF